MSIVYLSINFTQLFRGGGRYHIEISPLVCSTNQCTGFYVITASVMKELRYDPKPVRKKGLCEKGIET